MDSIHTIVAIEAMVVMSADIIAFAWIFKIYLRNKRRSALAFSTAWIFDFLAILSTAVQNPTFKEIGLLFLPTFSGLMFYGSVKFLEEESITPRHRVISAFAVMPVAFMAYLLAVYSYTHNALWTATSGATLGITGVFVVSGGLLLMEVEEIYKNAIKYLYISVILFGLHLVPAALFGTQEWYDAIGFTLSTILIVSMVTAMVKLTSMDSFAHINEEVPEVSGLKSGVIITDSKGYPAMKEKLRKARILAFIRESDDIPEEWEHYFVTNVPLQGKFKATLNPTDLPRMTELAYRYLLEMSKADGKGIILIDCVEYLMVYNQPESVMKFLAKIRDLTVVHNGTLILVVEKEGLGNKLYAQLKKLME